MFDLFRGNGAVESNFIWFAKNKTVVLFFVLWMASYTLRCFGGRRKFCDLIRSYEDRVTLSTGKTLMRTNNFYPLDFYREIFGTFCIEVAVIAEDTNLVDTLNLPNICVQL